MHASTQYLPSTPAINVNQSLNYLEVNLKVNLKGDFLEVRI